MNAAYEQLLEAPSPSLSQSLDTSKSFKNVEIGSGCWVLYLNSFVVYLVSQLCPNKFCPRIGTERFWTLNWGANGAIDDQLRKNPQGPRRTEEHGIKIGFLQAIVMEQHPRVLYLI